MLSLKAKFSKIGFYLPENQFKKEDIINEHYSKWRYIKANDTLLFEKKETLPSKPRILFNCDGFCVIVPYSQTGQTGYSFDGNSAMLWHSASILIDSLFDAACNFQFQVCSSKIRFLSAIPRLAF